MTQLLEQVGWQAVLEVGRVSRGRAHLRHRLRIEPVIGVREQVSILGQREFPSDHEVQADEVVRLE